MAEDTHKDATLDLLGTTDPVRWAQEFRERVLDGADIIDLDVLIGWFANAMQAKESSILGLGTHKLTTEDLHTLVFEAAGAATAPCLSGAPGLVMPTEEVVEGVNAVLASKGLPTSVDRHGDEAPDNAEAASSALDAGAAVSEKGGSPG